MNQYEQYIRQKGWVAKFRYELLCRLRSDCDYFLGYGCSDAKYLWAGNVTDHIGYMKALWESFPADAKPEWLPMEQILDYEKQMKGKGGL